MFEKGLYEILFPAGAIAFFGYFLPMLKTIYWEQWDHENFPRGTARFFARLDAYLLD